MKPTRPILRYHGGKWRIAPWIIAHFPDHRIYVEPFGGAGSVLMRKPRSFAEVYNDLDGDVVNVFAILRDPQHAKRLQQLLELTPWSRREFYLAYEPTEDPVERARRTIARAYMSFGTTGGRKNMTGFRAKAYRSNQTGCQDWVGYPTMVPRFTERLRGVCIEERNALEIMAQQDGADTLFYLDPPYVQSTRSSLAGRRSIRERAYRHDMTDEEHRQLAAVAHDVHGFVLLSGYASPLYDELYGDWERVERDSLADANQKRREVLWLSPRTAEALAPSLFATTCVKIGGGGRITSCS